jgi:hypothetical protein
VLSPDRLNAPREPAFSPVASGWMQVNYGFGPPFAGTISLYVVAIAMDYFFFLRGKKKRGESGA